MYSLFHLYIQFILTINQRCTPSSTSTYNSSLRLTGGRCGGRCSSTAGEDTSHFLPGAHFLLRGLLPTPYRWTLWRALQLYCWRGHFTLPTWGLLPTSYRCALGTDFSLEPLLGTMQVRFAYFPLGSGGGAEGRFDHSPDETLELRPSICFPQKSAQPVLEVFKTRHDMHAKVYQHKVLAFGQG